MKRVKQIVMMAFASLLAQCVWAAVQVGNTVTWSNTGTSYETASTASEPIGECNINIKLTPQDGLPAGSVVRIKKVRLASVNTSFVDWNSNNYNADASLIKINGTVSQGGNGYAVNNNTPAGFLADGVDGQKISSNATTEDYAMNYEFKNNVDLVVGQLYVGDTGNTANSALALCYRNASLCYGNNHDRATVRYIVSNDSTSVLQNPNTTSEGKYPVYEITAEVVSIPDPYDTGKKSISVNFNAANAAATVPDTTMPYGLISVPGSAWNNLTGTSGTNVSSFKSYDGTTTETLSGMSMTYSSNGSWNNTAATAPFMKYYLDIGTGANQVVNINIAGIPFTKYDVVIYTNYSTDTNPTTMWRAFKVNGTWYSVPSDSTDGVATEVEDSDAATTYWGGCNVNPTWGVNAMRVTNVSGNVLSIQGQNNNSNHRYGSVSAIQILEREDTAQYKDVTWDGSNWKCGDETIAALDSLCRVHLKDTDSVAFVADQVPFSIELPDSGEVTMSNTGNLGDFMINIPAATTLKLANKAGDNVGFVGAGTLKIGGTATDTKDNLQSWIANANVSGFSGTLYLNAGRFETNFVLTKNVTIRIPDGAQLSTGGSGEWNNHFIISGNGWTGELNNYRALSECAIRLENNLGDDAVIETVADGDKIPKVGNWNSDIQIKGKLKGSCDIAFGSFNAMHTYTFTRPHITTEFAGKVLQHNSKGKLKLTMSNNTTAAFGSAITCPVEVSVTANQTATLKTEITGTEGLTKTLWGTLQLNNGPSGYQVKDGKVTVSQGTVQLRLGNNEDPKIKNATFVIAARTNEGDTIKLDNHGWVYVEGTITIENADNTSVFAGTCFRPTTQGAELKLVKKGVGDLTFNSWYAVGSSSADFPTTCSIEVNGGKLTIPQRDSLAIHSPITLKDADAKFYSAATVDSVTTDVANKTVKQDADGVYCVVDLIEIAIPVIDHATASVVDGDGNTVTITDNKIKVADGTALTVTYTVTETNYVGGGSVELTAEAGATIDTSSIETPSIRHAGTIYSNAKDFSSFKISDRTVTPLDGDVISIADGYGVSGSDRWAINLSQAPAGHDIQIAYLDGGTDPGVSVYGVPKNMTVEIVENCRLYMQTASGAQTINDGVTIKGDGELRIQGVDANIDGDVTISSSIYFASTGVLKLNEGATLTVPTALTDGKVTSGVTDKKVATKTVEGKTVYGLVEASPEPIKPTEGTGTFTEGTVITDANGVVVTGTSLPSTTGIYTVQAMQDGFKVGDPITYAVVNSKSAESADAKTVAVAVPFKGATVANLLKTALLNKDDELKALNPETQKYQAWTLTAEKTWSPITTVTADGNEAASAAAATALERGTAVWVTTAADVVAFGAYDSTADVSEVTKGYNLIGNPKMEQITLEADTVGDVLIPVGSSARYTAIQKGEKIVWQCSESVPVTIPGLSISGSSEGVSEKDPTIQVGGAAWLIVK